jgi:ABC-2 type transport system permease protein
VKLAREIRLLWWRKILETVREPVWVFMGLATPLLYLALFAPVLHSLKGGPGFQHGSGLDIFPARHPLLMAFGARHGRRLGHHFRARQRRD